MTILGQQKSIFFSYEKPADVRAFILKKVNYILEKIGRLMSNTFKVSATIRAEQLLRINQESYCLDELLEHKNEVQSIYLLLISMRNSEKLMSRNEKANISHWTKKLFLKLSRINDLIQIAKLQENSKMKEDDSDETSVKSKKNSFAN
jgi:hypothetical protein